MFTNCFYCLYCNCCHLKQFKCVSCKTDSRVVLPHHPGSASSRLTHLHWLSVHRRIQCGIHDFFDIYQLSIITGNAIHFVLCAPELDRLL